MQFIGQVLGDEHDRYHGHAVEVEAVIVAEADRGHTHVQRQPQVDNPDINIQFVLPYEYVSDQIDQGGGNAEINQEGYLEQPEESPKPEYQEQDHRIHDQSHFFSAFFSHVLSLSVKSLYQFF